MATLRCIDCHKLFNPACTDTAPVEYDHRWCFVRSFKANKVETVTDFCALSRVIRAPLVTVRRTS